MIESEKRWRKFHKGSIIITAKRMDVAFHVEVGKKWFHAKSGDWVLLGEEGNLPPCSDSVFRKTYEALEKPVEKTSVESAG